MLYKYRGIKDFRIFTDIILKNRLYAAPYFDLNDPMEGKYLYSQGGDTLNTDMRRLLKSEKEKLRICALSRDPKNELMWSHYAEGHRGVVVGVEIPPKIYDVRPIMYDGPHRMESNKFHNNAAIDVLSHKLDVWRYEEEERVFTRGKQYVDVTVHRVICGCRMSTQDKGFITKLVKRINPNIEIINARTDSVYA